MVFSSVSFLLYFLPLFLILYTVIPYRNHILFLFSLFFYAWGEGILVLVLLLSTLVNHLFGKIIYERKRSGKAATKFLLLAVSANIAVLVYFKYTGFVLNSILGFEIDPGKLPELPLGISFYTFQSISFLVDVARGDSRLNRSFIDLGLYITMFPQLVAGPIVRYATVASQITHRVVFTEHLRSGLFFFCLGLAQKTLIANNAAFIADGIYGLSPNEVDSALAWLGSGAYTLQILFDFGGYSNMAIGLGMILGFRFPRNFRYPYTALSVTDFWRRWHISLSSWFRDYVYIPLGGNRRRQNADASEFNYRFRSVWPLAWRFLGLPFLGALSWCSSYTRKGFLVKAIRENPCNFSLDSLYPFGSHRLDILPVGRRINYY